MLDLEALSDDMLESLRSRGFTDEQIKNMPKERAFDECCMWHGLIGWGPNLREWWQELNEAEGD